MIVYWALALYLLVLGFLGGVVVERMRFDRQRTAVLQQYEDAARQLRARWMVVEQDVAARRTPQTP